MVLAGSIRAPRGTCSGLKSGELHFLKSFLQLKHFRMDAQ